MEKNPESSLRKIPRAFKGETLIQTAEDRTKQKLQNKTAVSSLKENSLQLRILQPVKLYFKNEGDRKIFLDQPKPSSLLQTHLKEILKGIHY